VVPAQLKWSDLHPPGVKVLPKGSPPAGAGEINWEDTLGGKFALALEQLEGLLYAVFGSRPGAYNMSGTWRKCQWYDRVHPRCLWGPEMWERQIITGQTGCNESGNCYEYKTTGKEYAALGENPPCCPMPKPSVPIRSRSGDPARQYERGVHDRTYFPLGSVERDYSTGDYDPEGSGWFGATQPGRNDAGTELWLATANGYTQKAGEAVKFYWTKPGAVATPTSVTLYYQLKAPGGAWGTWQTAAMTLPGGKYEAQLSAQQHGTECRWYVKYYYDGDPDVTKYEPGGDAAPADADAYYLQWFTHFNPYANGLPEMLDSYGGVNVRHGTDYYQFDGSEVVQPELLNMVRWVLSWLGGDCCTGEYETCAETDHRCEAFHHNPRFRGGDQGICCVPMPIRFRWSGSNVHPHYVTGGKGLVGGDTPDPRPLHNHPQHVPDEGDTWGSEAARKTWRGINMLYAGDGTTFDNPYYGGGYSWGTAPGTFKLLYEPDYATYAAVFAKYPTWGLRPGDVIEAVHLQEIIDAVAYLIDNGVWTTDPIKTCKKKPDAYLGKPCDLQYYSWASGPVSGSPFPCADESGGKHYYYVSDHVYPCRGCCGPTSVCNDPSAYYVYDDYYQTLQGGVYVTQNSSGTYNPDSQHCDDFPAADWEDCWNQEGDCTPGKCVMVACRTKTCRNWPFDDECYDTEVWESTGCNGTLTSLNCQVPPLGCGIYTCRQGCWWWDGWDEEWTHCTDGGYWGSHSYPCSASSRVASSGLSYHFCTGPACAGGWDDDHGGGHKKHRVDHQWPPNAKATGPSGGELSGNCFGDIYVCGTLGSGEHPNVWFQETRDVNWDGFASGWYTDQCDCTASSGGGCPTIPYSDDPPPIPGWGVHDEDGDPLCGEDYHKQTGGSNVGVDGKHCSCQATDFGPCSGDEAWAATDLNLDGTGTPYRNYAGIDDDEEPYTGRGVPRLRNYDLTKDPSTWMHSCPCETWTGESTCTV